MWNNAGSLAHVCATMAFLFQEKERREAIVRQMEEDQTWRKVKAEQAAAAAVEAARAAAAAEAEAGAAGPRFVGSRESPPWPT